MKHLYYIRHGESEANNGIWAGRVDRFSLTELGRRQARLAAEKAHKEGLYFDLMLVSPLKRAQQTADILEELIPIRARETNGLLIERDFGELANSSVADFFKAHIYQDIDKVKGAEKVEDLQQRAQKLLDSLFQRQEAKILLVGHSAFGRSLIRCVNKQLWTAEYSSETVVALPHAEIIQLI